MSKQPEPPQNLEAEEHVIGALMISQHAIMAAVDAGVTASDFYRASHGVMFQAAVDLDARNEPVDAITLAEELDRRGQLKTVGGKDRVREIATLVPAASNAGHYAKIVKETSEIRGLLDAGEAIASMARNREGTAAELRDAAERALFETAASSDRGKPVAIGDVLRDEYARIEHLYHHGGDVTGLPSDFDELDQMTTGLQPGQLVIVAGRPSMGKTAFALNVAENAALRHGKRSLVFSLEMSRGEIAQRMIASEASVESAKLRTGRLDAGDWRRIADACNRLTGAPIKIDDQGTITVAEIRSKARREKMQRPDLALVIIDYLQLIDLPGGEGNRAFAMGDVSRALKMLARDLEVPVVALAQLNRQVEQRADRRPMLSDLRDSGALEQDADLVVFLYRDDYYHDDSPDAGLAEVIVAKHRNGPTGMVKLRFTRQFSRFQNVQNQH